MDTRLRLRMVGVKDFNPNEPRNPHTGEWIDTPGLPSVQLLEHAGTPSDFPATFDSSVHGSARTALDSADAKAATETLNEIAQTHKWPDVPGIPIRPTDMGARGEFVQRGTQSREIRLQAGLGPEQTKQSLTHEMGHFLDASLAKGSSNFLSEGFGADGLPSPEMENFLRIARGSAAMQTVMKYASPAEQNYLNSPREIWARAYAQWITGTGETGNAGSWTAEDFKPIAQAVEAVLRERGLL